MSYRPQSVLHVLSSLNVGGAERFVIDLAVEQRESLGLNSAILSFGDSSEALVKECQSNDIPVYFARGGRLNQILTNRKIFRKYDVIHYHSPYTLLFACYTPFLSRSKTIIYTRHGAEPFNTFKWRFVHNVAKYLVNHITFVSNEAMSVFVKFHHWEGKSKTVIDNGILLPSALHKEQENGKLRLGSVARMVALKNQICLLRALSVLSNEIRNAYEIHFFGNGPCEELLRVESKKLNLESNVFFHGMQIDRGVIYSNMDLMVVTSEMEGLSIAILEAMARKIPVLATNVGGNPKLVKNNETGYLYDYDSHEMLSQHLTNIYDSPSIIKTWGENAYLMVKNSYSLELVAQKYMKLYLTK